MSLAFLVTALVIVATPGTGVVYTVGTGLGGGVRGTLVAAAGCTLGIVPHLLAAVTGLAAIVHASATAFATVKWAGVAYLLFLAWQTWRDRSHPTPEARDRGLPAWRIVRRAVLINLLNPKLTVFFFAFLPPFVDPAAGPAWAQMVGLGAVFMAMTFAVFAAYGAFAATVRTHVLARPRVVAWLRRSFAAAYVLLAGRLALAAR